jgi:hypothetical protein
MSKRHKISTLKAFICRDAKGKKRFNAMYKKLTVSQRLKEKNYSFEADY